MAYVVYVCVCVCVFSPGQVGRRADGRILAHVHTAGWTDWQSRLLMSGREAVGGRTDVRAVRVRVRVGVRVRVLVRVCVANSVTKSCLRFCVYLLCC